MAAYVWPYDASPPLHSCTFRPCVHRLLQARTQASAAMQDWSANFRYYGSLDGTTGQWLGVEWDDPSRGKHRGQHKGVQLFECLSTSPTAASFVRTSRRADTERTVLEAIRYKYGSQSVGDGPAADIVVISGKVAEEVGFDKIAKEQAQLAELKIVLIDQLVVNGLVSRGCGPEATAAARSELVTTCPNIVELDLGWNTIETWSQVVDIASVLPKLKTLKLGGLRFRAPFEFPAPLPRIRELHLEECLLSADDICGLLRDPANLPNLEELYLSGNHLTTLTPSPATPVPQLVCVKYLALENNQFSALACLQAVTAIFPSASSVSLQANQISAIGKELEAASHSFPNIATLNISDNQIDSYDFIDALPQLLPRLSSLRITNNPLFKQNETAENDSRAADKSHYLTLARIPSLQSLNHAKISPRDREEGEIYYLSVAEKHLNEIFSSAGADKPRNDLAARAHRLYPRYQPLATKYGRDSVIDLFLLPRDAGDDPAAKLLQSNQPIYPPGSLGARLVTAIFYIASTADADETKTEVKLTLPTSLAAAQVMGLLLQQTAFQDKLKPLQFTLVYESNELDPVDTTAESTTRSATYGKKLTVDEKRNLWKEWGDWDADAMVEEALKAEEGRAKSESGLHNGTGTVDEHWIEDGKVLIREGRKWKRRETVIPPALKWPWGDFLDGAHEVKIRIEPS